MDKNELLRNMLGQIAPTVHRELDSGLESLGTSFESAVSSGEDEFALKALKKITNKESLDPEEQGSLEAIILPRYRPVIDIIGGKYSTPPSPWEHLGEPKFKSKIEAAIPSVGRVEVPRHPRIPYAGTGFVVGPNLMMTNRHVAELFTDGLGTKKLTFRPGLKAAIDFKRELVPSDPILLEVKRVVMIHPFWDMALLEVRGLDDNHPSLIISIADPNELGDREVAIIGYPAQDPRNEIDLQNRIFRGTYQVKRLQPGRLKLRRQTESYGNQVQAATHDASTLGGNSGSAVIDVQTGHVVALHFAGEYLDANYGVPMHDLAQDSRVVDAGVNFAGKLVMDPTYAGLWERVDRGESVANDTTDPAPATPGDSAGRSTPGGPAPADKAPVDSTKGSGALVPGRPAQGVTLAGSGPAGFTLTIPIHVTISLGTPTIGRPETGGEGVRTESWFGWGAPKPAPPPIPPFTLPSLSLPGFAWRKSLSLAQASQLAYAEKAEVESRAQGEWGFEKCLFIERKATQCFVAHAPGVALVTFRGTTNTRDWMSNLGVVPIDRPYGTVHHGFQGQFQDVRDQLEAVLNGLGARKLLISGHSLGGAVAVIAAAEWKDKYSVFEVSTYGQPAVARGDTVSFLNQAFAGKYLRFVNDWDIVPRVPPGFYHAGKLMQFDGSGKLTTPLPTAGRQESLSVESADIGAGMLSNESFEALKREFRSELRQERLEGVSSQDNTEGITSIISDHDMGKYIAKIAGFVTPTP